MKKLILASVIFATLNLNAQNYLITFTGTGASATVTTVKVENLTAGTSLTLNGSDTLQLSGSIGISLTENTNPSTLRMYPNPTTGNSTIEICPPAEGDAVIAIYEISGKLVTQVRGFLKNSGHEFKLSGLKNGLYLISVTGNAYQFSGKLLCNGIQNGIPKIEKVDKTNVPLNEKTTKKNLNETQATIDMPYSPGERLKFTAISGNYSTIKTDIPTQNKTLSFNFIECKDGDNNNYPVVETGSQTWMALNLKATKYNDGTDIPSVTEANAWRDLSTPGYCWYNNDITLKSTYGALYNWFALNSGKLCPAGWHLPSDAEWITLANDLEGESEAGGKLKESGTLHWSTPNTGATDEKGFTSIPGGYRKDDGTYSNIGSTGLWWSTTEVDTTQMRIRLMGFDNSSLEWNNSLKTDGLSVRCLNGPTPVITIPALSATSCTGITDISAIVTCKVLSDGNATVTDRGIYWGTSQNPESTGTKLPIGSETGSFTIPLFGLSPNITYFITSYATNSAGTAYGNEISFTTNFVTAEQLLSDAVKSMTNMVFEISLGHEIGNCWVQHMAKVQYTDEDRYLPRTSTINNTWSNVYTECGKYVAQLKQMATYQNLENYKGAALVLQAYITSVATDLFGPVPYSEAWGDNTSPRYDDQEFIYRSLIANLDSANSILGTGDEALVGDNLYQGDMFAWKKFANSLRMRLILRMSSQDPIFATTELTRMIGDQDNYPIFESNEDNASFDYQSSAPDNNPINENRKTRDDYRVSTTVVDLMWNNSPNLDYRIALFAENLGVSKGYYIGLPNGLTSAGAAAYHGNGLKNTSKIGSYFTAATAPGVLMNWSEVLFIKSEAALKAYIAGGNAEAETNYRNAVYASYAQFGDALVEANAGVWANSDWTIDSLARDFYANDSWTWNPAYSTDEKMQLIATQKWAAMFDQGLQSWFEWRRTGYPVLNPAEDGLNEGQIPVRVYYPSSEAIFNSVNLAEGINLLGGGEDNLNTRVWWNSQTPIVLPAITTTAVSLITTSTAVSGGFVRSESLTPVTAFGVCWSTSGSPTISDNFTTDGSGTGAFTSFISGLEPDHTYSIRAYATTSQGTTYGIPNTFKTFPLIPTLSTTAITNITRSSATSGGDVIYSGGASVTARGICWSALPAPTVSDNLTLDGKGSGAFNSSLTGLLPHKTYYVRAYATNNLGSGYGPELFFTTNPEGIIAFNPDLTYGSVSDIDGNTYKTIIIGTQEWIAENIKTTKYSNGELIETTSPDTLDISGETTPEYQWVYEGDNNFEAAFGRLYTWYAATDSRNVCPDGWHVPTDAEWTILYDFLGGSTVAGGKLKETGTSNWIVPNTAASNQSGFTALPGGYRYDNSFSALGKWGFWWTASQTSPVNASSCYLAYNENEMHLENDLKNSGNSVRCLSGSETSIISFINPSKLIQYKLGRTPEFNIDLDIPGGAPIETIHVSYCFMRMADYTKSNIMTFDIAVNGANATESIVKSIPFTWDALRDGIVLPASPQIPASDIDPAISNFIGDYWEFSYVIIYQDGNELKNNLTTQVSIANFFAGKYLCTGIFRHPTAGDRMINEEKLLTPVSATACYCNLGDLGASGYDILINVESDNTCTVTTGPNQVTEVFMSAGLPNIYHPDTKIFNLSYFYVGGSGNRVIEEQYELIE
jgi:uncharacterized protein (TIGR02145 family)